jgi:hypothetical protein
MTAIGTFLQNLKTPYFSKKLIQFVQQLMAVIGQKCYRMVNAKNQNFMISIITLKGLSFSTFILKL